MTVNATLTIDDLTRVRWVAQPRPNPSGTHFAFTEVRLDQVTDATSATVVVCAISGRVLVRLDCPGWALVGTAWSPDGTRLAVAADAVRILSVEDHPGVAQVTAGMGAVGVSWSPSGERLAVEARHDASSKAVAGVYLIDAAGDTIPKVAVLEASRPIWTTAHTLVSLRTIQGVAQLCVTSTRSLTDVRVRDVTGPDRHVLGFAATHGGRRVAYLDRAADQPDEPPELKWLDLLSGMTRSLQNPPVGTIGCAIQADDPRGTGPGGVSWSAKSGRVYMHESAGGRGPLRWFDEDGRTGTIFDGDGVALDPGCSTSGLVLVVWTTPSDPGEVWALDEQTFRSVRLTSTNGWLSGTLGTVEPVTLGGAAGSVEGWLWHPPTPSHRPLVVSLHGGPYYAVGERFAFDAHRIAASGSTLLTLNPRGSAGRDSAYSHCIAGNWGGPDADDVESIMDDLARRGRLPSGAIVTGVSYGGFLAQLLLTRSGRFQAGVSENGISDFALLHAGTNRHRALAEWAMGGPPGASEHYLTRSPVRRVSRLSGPLLLLHAEDDTTCPPSQSRRMADAATRAGRVAELITLPGEGHLMNLEGRFSTRRRRAQILDGWMQTSGAGGPSRDVRTDRQGQERG